MKILVLNSGSSSIKYQLFEKPENTVLLSGVVERIGEETGTIRHTKYNTKDDYKSLKINELIPDHESGLKRIVDLLLDPVSGGVKDPSEIEAVGHRVVHGGEDFSKPTIVDSNNLKRLHELSYLAPLHNPHNLKGIEVAASIFKEAKQIAVFDTAFHQTMPEYAYRFSIPQSFYRDYGLRAYGFHGTSHQYVSQKAASFLNTPSNEFNAITIHLGNGCSMAAIKGGECVDTTMGLTPLGGLMMGTRSGDIDPSLIMFLAKHLSMSIDQIDKVLNKESGLKGITGDNDLRNILRRYDEGDTEAILAVEMYVYRIRKYIGAYAAILGRLDALVFTAGVGENSTFIRKRVCENLGIMGIVLDEAANESNGKGIKEVQSNESSVRVMIVPTNEEVQITDQVYSLLTGQ